MLHSKSFLITILFLSSFGCGTDNAATPDSGADAIGSDSSGFDQTVSETSKDATDADMSVLPTDVTILPGQVGAPCVQNSDCDSGVCGQTENDFVCLKGCGTSDCPAGYECNPLGGVDSSNACFSNRVRLCDPCNVNTDCNAGGRTGNVCLSFGNAGNFCGMACSVVGNKCPSGYSCQDLTIDPKTKETSSQCVPDSGQCECSPRASVLKLKTTCNTKNNFGSCSGSRFCGTTGLTGCDGAVPEDEVCDGIDNNCDGITDNIEQNPDTTCPKTNEFGTCFGKFIGCSQGKAQCDAPLATPEKCNGLDDNCDGQTDENLCNDGNSCTSDKCNTDGSCNNTKLSGFNCDDGNICTQFSQCSAGACVSGSNLACDDNDPCTVDSCDPFTGCVHNPATEGKCIDDGNLCTDDVCVDGKCSHPIFDDGTLCLPDGDPCTDNKCSGGKCKTFPNKAECNDNNPCTENDHCNGNFSCSVSTALVCDDGNPCTLNACDPKSKNGCVFLPDYTADNQACLDDGIMCTQDACLNGVCNHDFSYCP